MDRVGNHLGPALQTRDRVLEFGQYRLDVRRRSLTIGKRQVYVTSRALSILIALAEGGGAVVGKRELHALVWPNEVVEESTLRVHIAALRKVLGERPRGVQLVQNVHGRGYRLAVPVTELSDTARSVAQSMEATESGPTDRIGEAPLIGREAFVKQISAALREHRLVTVTGPGGIGKTTVSREVVEALAPGFVDDVLIVDLASPNATPLQNVLNRLTEQPTVLLLDNCEAALDGVASIVQEALSTAPLTRILATSSEQLHVCGERVYSLAPLPVHSQTDDAGDTRQALLASPAVALFLQRAAMADDSSLSDDDLHQVARLCRRLDGNPLAIEIVAGWRELLGLPGLTAAVIQGHYLSIAGPRAARHRTLREMLDASYNLLSDAEQRIFRRSGVFLGSFDLKAAAGVMSGANAEVTEDDIFATLLSLASKSLLLCDNSGGRIRYRLNEISRAYALAKLRENEEFELTRRKCTVWMERIVATEADARGIANRPTLGLEGSPLLKNLLQSADLLSPAQLLDEWNVECQKGEQVRRRA